MKYLTPALFARTNSQDIDEAIAASDEWEAALKSYRRRLSALRRKLPPSVVRFVDHNQLHDFEVLGLARSLEKRSVALPELKLGYLFVRGMKSFHVLNYILASEPNLDHPTLPERLKGSPPIWLYDEFDREDDHCFSHEIFLSTGTIIKFRFSGFQFSSFETSPVGLPSPEAGDLVGQLLPL